MSNSNAIAVALCASNGVLDKMQLATYCLGVQDMKDLAAYEAKLKTKRTTLTEDQMFLEKFCRVYNSQDYKK